MHWLDAIAAAGTGVASFALAMTVLNLWRLRSPVRCDSSDRGDRFAGGLSVCIPARNEAGNLEACVASVLAGGIAGVRVLVYDDESDDGTSEILARLTEQDDRVIPVPTHALPGGWCGKQHACWRLARFAGAMSNEDDAEDRWLLFIDADVRIEAQGLLRTMCHAEMIDRDGRLGMLSTFPRQVIGSLGEGLLVTSIFFLLLSYLPMGTMRRTLSPAASAACGQFMLVRHTCYRDFGGHEALKDSMHDGVRMPRLARAARWRTDIFDGPDIASCRMYVGFAEAWRGFAKNAYEGLGSPVLLVFLTVLHLSGHILPPLVLVYAVVTSSDERSNAFAIACAAAAVLIGIGQRLLIAKRERHAMSSALLHSLSVLLMTLVQWWSWYLSLTGRRSWRGRKLRGVNP